MPSSGATRASERVLDFFGRKAIVGVPGLGVKLRSGHYASVGGGINETSRELVGVTSRVGSSWGLFVAEASETIGNGLAAYYEYVAAQVHRWVDPLSNEQFWRNPYPYGNSVGHLVLHLTGNLNYYIGARVAETGYVRDRDREFTDKQPPQKAEALQAFDRTIVMVVDTIRKQSAADWGKTYTAEREPEAENRFQIFVRCAGHAYHHVGQMVYLSRELART
jgi:uncharacterized damage-inducible protein DinB